MWDAGDIAKCATLSSVFLDHRVGVLCRSQHEANFISELKFSFQTSKEWIGGKFKPMKRLVLVVFCFIYQPCTLEGVGIKCFTNPHFFRSQCLLSTFHFTGNEKLN